MASPSRFRRVLEALRTPADPPARRNVFTGAAVNRLTMDWVRSPLAADKEVEYDLVRLKGRARDLVKNQPYARRWVQMARSHIVGPKGVLLRPEVTYVNGKRHDPANEAIEYAWGEWSRPQHASANGRLSWLGLQRLAVSEWATAGEALILIRYGRQYRFGMALQPIDADRLDDQFSRAANSRTGELAVRMGVEVDDIGTPVAYHILDVHPSLVGSTFARAQARRRIPADQVIHLYANDERVEQSRGVPPLATAMRDLRHADGFQEAALVKMRTAAAAMGFIVTKDANGDTTEPTEGLEFAGEAGVFRELGLNQEVQSWDPKEPATSFGEFMKAILRSVAASLGVSYASMANDLEAANYSSMRVGRAEEQETWMERQTWFIDQFCERVFAAWFPAAVLSGALDITLSESRDMTAHRWIPRRWASVDPVKDVEADERRVALGVLSRQTIAGRDGDDLWEEMERLAEEQDEADRLSLNIDPPRTAGGAKPNDGTQGAAGAQASDGSHGGTGRGRAAGGGGRSDPGLAVVRSAGGSVVRA